MTQPRAAFRFRLPSSSTARLTGAVASAVLVLAGCGVPAGGDRGPRTDGVVESPGATGTPPSIGTGAPDGAAPSGRAAGATAPSVAAPGEIELPLHSADLLVYSAESFTPGDLSAIERTKGVSDLLPFALAQTNLEERIVTVAAVPPAQYRRWTPSTSATLQAVWDRVAAGEMAVSAEINRKVVDAEGNLGLGNDASALRVHVGAWLTQVPRIDLTVNDGWIDRLGMRPDNAVLVTTGLTSPQEVKKKLQTLVGRGVSVQLLGPDLDTSAVQTALLTGGDVGAAIGSFSYTVLGGGRIAPDPAWVRANVRTEEVPILGTVTCHRVMLPQLRAALTEVVQRGLSATINPGEYAGCYYPRFIANSTSLSNHSFGTALDMNVPGNQRGTTGEMNREVVAIFKKWGFAWGGDWNWTDPMHFELSRIVTAG